MAVDQDPYQTAAWRDTFRQLALVIAILWASGALWIDGPESPVLAGTLTGSFDLIVVVFFNGLSSYHQKLVKQAEVSVARLIKIVLIHILAIALFIGVVIALIELLEPEESAKAVTIVSTVLIIFSVMLLIRSYRKERPFKRWPRVLTLVTPLLTFSFYLIIFPNLLQQWQIALAGAAVLGLTLGLVWSRATRLYPRQDQVYGKNAGWWLLVWALSFLITQGMVWFGRLGQFNLSLVILAFSSTLAMGVSLGLLWRIGRVRKQLLPGAAAGNRTACVQCGARLDPGKRFCVRCGAARS